MSRRVQPADQYTTASALERTACRVSAHIAIKNRVVRVRVRKRGPRGGMGPGAVWCWGGTAAMHAYKHSRKQA